MEHAGRLIGNLKLPKAVLDPEAMARSAWPAAVGKKIAARTRAIKLVRHALVVECEDAVWQRQLNTLQYPILQKLQALLGDSLVTSLDLRPMTPRRGMRTAEVSRPFVRNDEADRIQDPVFRMLYKQSRRKVTGLNQPVQETLFEFPETERRKARA